MTLDFVAATEVLEQARVAVFRAKLKRALVLDGKSMRTRQETKELRELMAYFAADGEDS